MHLPKFLSAPDRLSQTASAQRVLSRLVRFGALLSAAMLWCAPAALAQSRTASAPLLEVEGALQPGDTVLSADNSLYDVHTFEAEAGQAVVITMESTQFDTYLLLLNEDGQGIAQNDDASPTDRNSSIAVVLPESGTYQILANAYDATGRGAYRLTVRLTDPTDAAVRAAASGAAQVPVEGVINGDQLVTINGIPWAARNWQFSRVLGIQRDSIDSTVVGRVVLDRHGEDTQPEFGIRSPFAAPEPGRVVFVSAWGSNNSGCFVELIVQAATTADQTVDASLIIPTRIELVVGGERVTLEAAQNVPGVGRHHSFQYSYSALVSQNDELVSVNYPGLGVMARHLFPVSADQARILRSAPAQDVPIRVTLTNRSPITIPIGDATVERWSSVFGYNPACASN